MQGGINKELLPLINNTTQISSKVLTTNRMEPVTVLPQKAAVPRKLKYYIHPSRETLGTIDAAKSALQRLTQRGGLYAMSALHMAHAAHSIYNIPYNEIKVMSGANIFNAFSHIMHQRHINTMKDEQVEAYRNAGTLVEIPNMNNETYSQLSERIQNKIKLGLIISEEELVNDNDKQTITQYCRTHRIAPQAIHAEEEHLHNRQYIVPNADAIMGTKDRIKRKISHFVEESYGHVSGAINVMAATAGTALGAINDTIAETAIPVATGFATGLLASHHQAIRNKDNSNKLSELYDKGYLVDKTLTAEEYGQMSYATKEKIREGSPIERRLLNPTERGIFNHHEVLIEGIAGLAGLEGFSNIALQNIVEEPSLNFAQAQQGGNNAHEGTVRNSLHPEQSSGVFI